MEVDNALREVTLELEFIFCSYYYFILDVRWLWKLYNANIGNSFWVEGHGIYIWEKYLCLGRSTGFKILRLSGYILETYNSVLAFDIF